VKDITTGKRLGYVFKTLNLFGEYGITKDFKQALHVSFEAPLSGKPFDLIAQNQVEHFDFVGGIVGFSSSSDDLKHGSPNYAYLGGVNTHTTPDHKAVAGVNSFTTFTSVSEHVESALWQFRPIDFELTPKWVNTDGHKPDTTVVWSADDNLLAVTGDYAAFQEAFGPVPKVKLVFIPF